MDALSAYAAGLIDGEGCISILRYNDKRHPNALGPRTWVQIAVGLKEEEPLRLLWKRWGGSLIIRRNLKKNPKWTDIWMWQINCQKAYRLIEDIQPYLIVKKKQAELALEFRDYISKHFKPSRRLTQEIVDARDEFYWRSRELNGKQGPQHLHPQRLSE